MRALIAFDKFKDALTAIEACEVAQTALQSCQPTWELETAPLADGGDGFCDTLTAVLDGAFLSASVIGPLCQPLHARFGIVSTSNLPDSAKRLLDFAENRKRIAIIEMAESSGIALTPIENRSPWITTSAGLGDQLLEAVSQGAEGAIVGLGGSATHDLALGALWRLGFRFFDAKGFELKDIPTPERWSRIARIDSESNRLPPDFEVRLACDVENPLLGPQGAAAIFGPQKGLSPERYEEMENLTRLMADCLIQACKATPDSVERPGTGAAGGAAFGLQLGLGARIVSGYELVKSWIGLAEKLNRADLVLTGEGRFDASSLQGKGPGALALEARARGKRFHIFCGSLGALGAADLTEDCLSPISPPDLPLAKAIQLTRSNLSKAIIGHFS